MRYIGKPAKPTGQIVSSRHERFIDYGFDEAIAYIRFSLSVGDVARLDPLTLASVDPQAF